MPQKTAIFYCDGIHAVESLDGAYFKVTYYSLARPRGVIVERRILPLCIVRPCTSLLSGDCGLAQWLRKQSSVARLNG